MAQGNEPRYKIYTIPDNFIDEGRITAGMVSVRTRFLVEAIIYGLVFAVISLLIPVNTVNTRLTVTIVIAGPAVGLGLTGINGEPVSITVKHVCTWWTNRQIMLYDDTPRVLISSPVDNMLSESSKSNALMKQLEERRKKKLDERESREFILGQNFEFAADRDYTREYSTLEELIQSQIEERKAAIAAAEAEEDIIEILPTDVEENFTGPILPDEKEKENNTLSISTDASEEEQEDALAAISYMDTPLISISTDDSDEITFDEGEDLP